MSVDLTQNYFELFGLPVTYAIDRDGLDQRYRELQRLVHPDRFARASDQERRIAMQQATQINEGYRVLKDGLMRARYLLELRGHRFDDERSTHQDSAFLMEQMELREALAEVREAADPPAALAEVQQQVDARMGQLTGELTSLLGAETGIDERALQAVQQMQFFRKLALECDELEAEFD